MFNYLKSQSFMILLIIQSLNWNLGKNAVTAASIGTNQEDDKGKILEKGSAQPDQFQQTSFIQRINGLRQDEGHKDSKSLMLEPAKDAEKSVLYNYLSMEKEHKEGRSQSADIPPPLTYRQLIEKFSQWHKQKEQYFYDLNLAAERNQLISAAIDKRKKITPTPID